MTATIPVGQGNQSYEHTLTCDTCGKTGEACRAKTIQKPPMGQWVQPPTGWWVLENVPSLRVRCADCFKPSTAKMRKPPARKSVLEKARASRGKKSGGR